MGFDQAARIGRQTHKAQIHPECMRLSRESYDVYDERGKGNRDCRRFMVMGGQFKLQQAFGGWRNVLLTNKTSPAATDIANRTLHHAQAILKTQQRTYIYPGALLNTPIRAKGDSAGLRRGVDG